MSIVEQNKVTRLEAAMLALTKEVIALREGAPANKVDEALSTRVDSVDERLQNVLDTVEMASSQESQITNLQAEVHSLNTRLMKLENAKTRTARKR